jgi:tRNA (cytidine/uridine-2'-O-)-methyltransferase
MRVRPVSTELAWAYVFGDGREIMSDALRELHPAGRRAYHSHVFHVILFRPEIPPNTGNLIRLCANVGATLHLVHPLGFAMEDRQLRRAGLDYHELVSVREHADLPACLAAVAAPRLFALTTRATRSLYGVRFAASDAFLFGPETSGLPADVLDALPVDTRLRIPMRAGNRSLNLSNAAAVTVYEAWRQLGFAGAG